MALVLEKAINPATVKLSGQASLRIENGKRLTIETSPGGHEILDELVPIGKDWIVTIRIDIAEVEEVI